MSQISLTGSQVARSEVLYRQVLAAYEALGFPPSVVNSWAISPNDVPDLVALALGAQPKNILEVGTYVGVSTMILALSCPQATIVTVDPDLPLEIEMGATRSNLADADATATTLSIARAAAAALGLSDRIRFVKGGFAVTDTFSSTLKSGGPVTELVGPGVCSEYGPFDFVFIDGLHTSEAVASDLALSTEHLAPHGVVALHDCVGFWGANVRAGILDFLRTSRSYRFRHPPFSDLWRTLGVLAPVGSRFFSAADFSKPLSAKDQPAALRETFSVLLSTVFGQRDVLEVYAGSPYLSGVGDRAVSSVQIRAGGAAQSPNAELDRILNQFDRLQAPVLFSADMLDFASDTLVHQLLAAVAHRKGALLFGVTPAGELGVAGPESRSAAWLVEAVQSHGLSAFAPNSIDLEPARYGLFAEMRELGRDSRFASFIAVAPPGQLTDGRGRPLVELTTNLAMEREQAEVQRAHLALGFHRFFQDSAFIGRQLGDQTAQYEARLGQAAETLEREQGQRAEAAAAHEQHLAAAREELTRLEAKFNAKADLAEEFNRTELAAREAREQRLLQTIQEMLELSKREIDARRLIEQEQRAVIEGRSVELEEAVRRVRQLSRMLDVRTASLVEAYQAIDQFDAMIGSSESRFGRVEETAPSLTESGIDALQDVGAQATAAQLKLLRTRWQRMIDRVEHFAERQNVEVLERLSALEGANAQLQHQLDAITSSTIWRATAPLRRSVTLVSVLKRKLRARSRVQTYLHAKRRLDALLAAQGLSFPSFDVEAYTRADGNVVATDSLLHYFEFGEHEGRRPYANFDPQFYLTTYSDVRASGTSPLLHFMKFGIFEGRSPCGRLNALAQLAADRAISPVELFARS